MQSNQDPVPAIKEALAQREYFRALDLVRAWDRGRARARILEARALQGLGALSAAADLITSLTETALGDQASEAAGVLGSIHKDRAKRLVGSEAREALVAAQRAYARGARLAPEDYWHTINQAALSMVLGDLDAGRALASEVAATTEARLRVQPDDGWAMGTLAEALLLLERDDEAWPRYEAFATSARAQRDWFQLASLRRNPSLILASDDPRWTRLLEITRIPPVVQLVGHIVDRPGRAVPRFAPDRVPEVERVLGDWIAANEIALGVTGAAAGADLLFHRVLAEAGVPTAVVLPTGGPWYEAQSVSGLEGGDWLRWHRDALSRAQPVIEATRDPFPDAALAFAHAATVMDGYARSRAESLETELVRLAVWDGAMGDGPGGTADHIRRWARDPDQASIHVLDPSNARAGFRRWTQPTTLAKGRAPRRRTHGASLVASLCFADVVGYSRLGEAAVLAFAEHVLQPISSLLETSGEQVIHANTWGDAVFASFDDVAAAAAYAQGLAALFDDPPWPVELFDPPLGIRVALHAAPVYCVRDPILKKVRVSGAAVSHAARIEPVTPPGGVYGSASFVGLLHASVTRTVASRYVGQVELAKGFGSYPTYELLPPQPKSAVKGR